VIGGGFLISGATDEEETAVHRDGMSSDTTWQVAWSNDGNGYTGTMTVQAICASVGP
jgi:hypothetical protein